VYFKLPNELFLTNLGSQINTILLDADNGQGYQNLPFDTAIPLQFYQNKMHDLTFKITLNNGQTLYCRSKFKIDDPVLDNPFTTITKSSSNVVNRVYITQGNNFFNGAWLTIRRIPGNNEITRPLIIAEGLDTGNFTAPEDFGGKNTFEGFQRDIDQSGNNLRNLIDEDRNHTYDLIYIDWARGMADLRDNSGVLEEVIKWVNANKTATAEPNVLLGQSMGGVIGRYTLARMENAQATNPNAPDHDVRLFVAHDSPMQGANTPLGLAHFSAHMKQEYVAAPAFSFIGEVLVPIGFGLAELGSNFLNFFGANTSVPSFVTPAQLLSLQDQTASKQLNYWSIDYSSFGGFFGTGQSQTNIYNLAWQQTLENEGWPQQSRNIAISNGNECGVDNGFAPGDPLLQIDSTSNPGFLLDVMNMFLAPYIGFNTLDPGLFILGLVPGSSTWQTNFDINSYGNQGNQNQIYRGRIRYEKRVLWVGPNISYDITNQSYNAPSQALPFETYSGGILELLDDDGEFSEEIPIIEDLIDVINDSYGFIPVVSALDIKKTNGNDPTPIDYLKSYSGGTPSDPNLVSGFDAFIVDNQPDQPTNNEHLSFQVRNGNWLADELEAESPADYPVVVDCSFACDGSSAITGSGRICDSETYNFQEGPTFINWSINPSNAANISVNTLNPNQVTVTRNSSYNGTATLIADAFAQGCGSNTITKNVWFGGPNINQPTSVSGPNNINPGQTGLFSVNTGNFNSASSFTWVLFSYQFPNASQYFELNQVHNGLFTVKPDFDVPGGFYSVQLRATNGCGFYPVSKTFYVEEGDGTPVLYNKSSNIYKIYPNPSSTTLNISLVDKTQQPLSSENIFGELLDLNGLFISRIEIYDHNASVNASNLRKGIYILRIHYDGKSEGHQVIVE